MAVPGRLPRVVPTGDPFIVDGKPLPPGVSFLVSFAFQPKVELLTTHLPVSTDNRWNVHLYHAYLSGSLGSRCSGVQSGSLDWAKLQRAG